MKLKFPVKFIIACFLFTLQVDIHAQDNETPTGEFDNQFCLECHRKDDAQIINDWNNSQHARTHPVTDCVACHGKLHELTVVVARQDTACIECHGGKKSPVVHSYLTSKHGVLMQLEQETYDWQQPLTLANYRSPGCSYCHMHQGKHHVDESVRGDLMNPKPDDTSASHIRIMCQECHSQRYIASLLDNGEEMLEIARKKLREAMTLIDKASKRFSSQQLQPAREQLKLMQKHLKNVYLGAGHQSPDYQWWHGQPALDGDLLRIKGHIERLYADNHPEKIGSNQLQ